MPPKPRFNKEIVLSAALEIVRESGIKNLTARALALKLNSSPQPIFSFFENMDVLKKEVITAVRDIYLSFTDAQVKNGAYPPYKASGMAYIKFAREEKHFFEMLFMSNKSDGITIEIDINEIVENISNSIKISREQAELFHIEMWTFVHGIATMAATGYLELDEELVSEMITDIYKGLLFRFTERKGL